MGPRMGSVSQSLAVAEEEEAVVLTSLEGLVP